MGFGSWALTHVLSRTVSRGHVEVRARKSGSMRGPVALGWEAKVSPSPLLAAHDLVMTFSPLVLFVHVTPSKRNKW